MQHEELTNEDQMELEDQRKDEERQNEEMTEEPQRFMTQLARGLCLFEEALLAFEAQEPNAEWNMMATAVDQNAAQCILCYSVSSGMRKKELLPRHHWIIFSTG